MIPERGWSAVSTRTLAERAGVTPSVVHYHYPSLRALLNDAVVEMMRGVLDDLDSALTEFAPEAAVEQLLAQASRFTGEDPSSVLAVEGYLAAGRDPELRERLHGLMTEFRGRFTERLTAGGVPDPETTGTVLVAALDGLVLHRGLGVSPDAAALGDVLRRLVTPPPAPPTSRAPRQPPRRAPR